MVNFSSDVGGSRGGRVNFSSDVGGSCGLVIRLSFWRREGSMFSHARGSKVFGMFSHARGSKVLGSSREEARSSSRVDLPRATFFLVYKILVVLSCSCRDQ